MWVWSSFERFFQDLRFGLRVIRRNPGLTAVMILTLALGVCRELCEVVLSSTVCCFGRCRMRTRTACFTSGQKDRARGITDLNISFPSSDIDTGRVTDAGKDWCVLSPELEPHHAWGSGTDSLRFSDERLFQGPRSFAEAWGRSFLREEEEPGGANVGDYHRRILA